MAFEDKKIPYELLVRYGLDGKPAGAHVQYRQVLVVDDVIRSDTLGPAEPIDLAGFPTSSIMSDTARDALAEIAWLNARVDGLTTDLNAASDTLLSAVERADLLAQENEALIAEIDGLRRQIAEPREATAAMVQAGALAFSPNEVLPTEVEADVMSRVYHAMEMDRVAQRNGS